MKVVLVATSNGYLTDHPTGVWLEELAGPYFVFQQAGYDITIASPLGGAIPIDKASLGDHVFTDDTKKFLHDPDCIGMLSHSTKLTDIDFTKDVDVIFMTGGHGTCVDFINQPSLKSAIETMFNSGKVVGAVCHGLICLTDCVKEDGSPLVEGLEVTGFTNSEEKAVELDEFVPFLLEDKLNEQGGKYQSADDWESKVCSDSNLVTGQNPQSSVDCAKKIVEVVKNAE
eukprot:CAMPEP_0197250870 /NCGR_PEP_ID=MMETSP1429-20130617/54680_1 /TAXON_ID=49237 /ORGANISM="Chaetoceros  sp., Strain UNC1202" /LENGTH=227 /DNA_ID=CAMNT_0042712805 /DNA_START=72 /DNA_END=755 /DNA_ORIENTATION=+